MPVHVTLPISAILPSTPTTRVLRLDLTGCRFEFRAGQAAMLGLHGHVDRKPYSIVSTPDEARRERRLEFLIKVDETGRPGAHLAGWRPGALVDLKGPLGGFLAEEVPDAPVLFVAGGTGIAPLRSLLRDLLARGASGRLRLVQSARSAAEFAFADEFRQLATEGRIEWYPTVTGIDGDQWTGTRGRVGRDLLGALVDGTLALCFVCGPPEMVDAVRSLLGRLGVPDDRIRREAW